MQFLAIIEEKEKRLAAQNHNCLICAKHVPLRADRCLKTDIIRAYICTDCKIALRCVHENSDIAAKLLKYTKSCELIKEHHTTE